MDTINVIIDNKEAKEFPKGITLYEISNTIDYKPSIVGAKINNSIVHLSTPLTEDTQVEFINYCDVTGYKMYQAGLKFIMEVALKEIYPNMEIEFQHSVPKGVLAQFKGSKKFTNEDIGKIKGAMAKIIDENHIIERYNMEKRDILTVYAETKEEEKAENIQNINDELVRIYKLKNCLNYFYVEMPYNTGAINKFDMVYLGNNKVVFMTPSARSDGKVPEYVHYENIIDSFEAGKQYADFSKVPYISNLNKMISDCKISDLIKSSELLFDKRMFDVIDDITSNPNRKVVLIAGPSSTGKTTTMKRIAAYLKAKAAKPICISVDDYFVDREHTPKKENGEYDFECLLAIDINKFNSDINLLLQGEEIELPSFDFVTGKRIYTGNKCKMQENSVILIEGLHALNDDLTPSIDPRYKYKIYLSPFIPVNIDRHNYISTTDLRLFRRIIRDNRTRGMTVSETLEMWQSVRDGEEKYIFPYVHQADIILNTSFVYELGVMRVFVEPLLYSVKMDSPYYEEAVRLLKFLKNFLTIPTEYISSESILREFIGYGFWKGN